MTDAIFPKDGGEAGKRDGTRSEEEERGEGRYRLCDRGDGTGGKG